MNKSNPTGVDEKLLCVHCGSNDHDLPDCHLITGEELGQILVQLKADEIQDSAEGTTILQSEKTDKTLAKAKNVGGLLRSRLYLNTCTTNGQMTTREYLTDIHQAPKSLKMHTNSGSSLSSFKGKLVKLPFWLNNAGIANVISLLTLEKNFHVTYDSKASSGCFTCHTASGNLVATSS